MSEPKKMDMRDYGLMLWEGKPVGTMLEFDKPAVMRMMRSGMEAHRRDPAALDRDQLAAGRLKADRLFSAKGRPPRGAVAFVGSSTFTFWRRLKQDFAGLAVYNAAFGGSQTHHLLDEDLFERLVAAHEPSQVVYFCGTNDIAHGREPEHALDGFARFYRLVRQRLGPSVRMVVLALTQTPFFRHWGEPSAKAARTNALLAGFCAEQRDDELNFVDHNAQPWASDPAYYVSDNHHMNDEGHAQLAAVLRPHLGARPAALPARL